MKTLAELRDDLKAAREKAAGLKDKAYAAGAPAADVTAYTDALKAVQTLLTQVNAKELEERLEGKEAVPANAGIGHNSRQFAVPKISLKPEQKVLMGMAAVTKSAILSKEQGVRVDPLELLDSEGFGEYAAEQKNHALMLQQKAGVASTISNGVLLPKPVVNDILPILYPETTFLQGDPVRVDLISGQYRLPRGQSSATAGYVAEGAKKPVGAPGFDDTTMAAHKLAGIVYLTNEAAKWTLGRLEAYIRQDLRAVLGLKMDAAMYFGTGTGATPTGIFNKSGITTITGTYTTATKPTVAELDTLAQRMMLAMTSSNIARTSRWRWVMGYRTQGYLTTLRDGNGNSLFPQVEANGTWKGIPILVSNQIVENGGGTTDEATLGLVDFGHVLFGEEEDMTMRASTEATIDDGGTLVLLWQQNQSAILAEMSHDVGLRQSKAVVKSTVRWAA